LIVFRALRVNQKVKEEVEMKSKWFMFLAVLTVCAFLLTPGQAKAEDVIKIGLTISTTGSYTFASSQGFKGVSLWADYVNEHGGLMLKGKKVPVKLIYYDDRSDKETVVKLYEKLINEDKVDVCFAPFGSTLTGAAAAITEKYGKMHVIWSAASDAIYEQGHKYIVSATETPVSLMPKPEIDHMASLGVKKLAVIYVDDVRNFPVQKYGPMIETNPLFPRRTNVEFVQVVGPGEVIQRTWERGSGETMACGTGASAVTVAGVLTKRTGRSITVHLSGGDLEIEWNEKDNHVYMTGPAVEVFEGVWPD